MAKVDASILLERSKGLSEWHSRMSPFLAAFGRYSVWAYILYHRSFESQSSPMPGIGPKWYIL